VNWETECRKKTTGSKSKAEEGRTIERNARRDTAHSNTARGDAFATTGEWSTSIAERDRWANDFDAFGKKKLMEPLTEISEEAAPSQYTPGYYSSKRGRRNGKSSASEEVRTRR